MKKTIFFLGISLLVTLTAFSQEGRKRSLFDADWKFNLGEVEQAQQAGLDDSEWRELDLPHDWSIEGPFSPDAPAGGSGGYLPGGIGWYRKTFTVPQSEIQKTVWIDFDGAYMNSDVWINGHHLGRQPFGYGGFYFDITSHLQEGENTLAVRVDNTLQPNSRWYSGSGIYRHVWLTVMDPMHVAHWGTYVTTPEITEGSAKVRVRTNLENLDKGSRQATLRSIIIDSQGKEVVREESPVKLTAGQSTEIDQSMTVENPSLWSVETPNMYSIQTEIVVGNKVTDMVNTPFGIRHIEYSSEKGLLLNGEQVKMKGVCLHHDGGCMGAAVPERVWERRFEVLKQMGCNAIRTSHNPMAPEFMDLCDRMGFLVQDEVFDEWTVGKVEHGYHNYFEEWSQIDLVSFIHRDRNHPSVVMWSAGNEIGEQSREGGHEILRPLIETFHREDPSRLVTTGNDHIAADGGSALPDFLNMLDIVGYNYVDRWHERRELYYSIDKLANPEWLQVGTESSSNGGVRGMYTVGRDPDVVRAGYNSRMIRSEQLWKFESLHDYVIGDFMWTGIDYLGESRWPSKNSSSGVIDMCGFPKDGFYFYQSQWTDEPVLHLLPHWNWSGREQQVFPVIAYTNCDTVELYLNGRSFGAKSYELPRQGNSERWNRYAEPKIRATTADLHLAWDVPYEAGILKAVGRKNGKIVIVKEVKTTGPPASVRLSVDRATINADAEDVAHIIVEIVDKDGLVVPTASNHIQFNIKGEGKLIGVGNGNPMDHASFQIPERDAFNGLALAIIQSSAKSGKISIRAESAGLKGDVIEIQSVK
jgi:beta-galactosidase